MKLGYKIAGLSAGVAALVFWWYSGRTSDTLPDNAKGQQDRAGMASAAPVASAAGPRAGGETPAQLAAMYAGEENAVVRERLLQRAARSGKPEGVKWLAQVAGQDEKMGARAAAALGSTASSEAAAALAELATGQESVIVRANAARALGASGDSEQAPMLAGLVADSKQPLRVRQEAALALIKVGTAEVVPQLVSTLEAAGDNNTTEGEQLRIAIVRALGAIGSPNALAALAGHGERSLSKTERVFLNQALRR